jgi:hypothetical protein
LRSSGLGQEAVTPTRFHQARDVACRDGLSESLTVTQGKHKEDRSETKKKKVGGRKRI